MDNKGLLKTGIIGTVIVAICCFTPILIWLLAAMGLVGAVIYLDLILVPLLIGFVGLTIWGWSHRKSVKG